MGYTTEFEGRFQLDRPLNQEHSYYLKAFSEKRRMKRDPKLAEKLPDPDREAVGLPIGPEGAYFVGGTGFCGQDHDRSITDYNQPPKGQPGLWCQWAPCFEDKAIAWDGGEKFYDYVEWLEYLIEHFLKPWGYKLNGSVTYQGEDPGDMGRIVVKNNKIKVQKGRIVYSDAS